jgi:hypothetical protein
MAEKPDSKSTKSPDKSGDHASEGQKLDDLLKQIGESHKLFPVTKEQIQQKDLVFTGSSLKHYNQERGKNKEILPDKTLKGVQDSILDTTFARLNKGVSTAKEIIQSKSVKRETPKVEHEKPLFPRTLRINLSQKAAESLGFSYKDDKVVPEEKFKLVNFADICRLLPPQSMIAPANPLLHKVKTFQPLHVKKPDPPSESEKRKIVEETSSEKTDSAPEPERKIPVEKPTPAETDEDHGSPGEGSTPTEDQTLKIKVGELLDQLHGSSIYDQVYSDELQSKKQSALYGALGEEAEKQFVSAADATAYYDFYDLKIAWQPVWTEVFGTEGIYTDSVPDLVKEFLPHITMEQWTQYSINILIFDHLDAGWESLIKAAAEWRINMLLGETTLSYMSTGRIATGSSEYNQVKSELELLAAKKGESTPGDYAEAL